MRIAGSQRHHDDIELTHQPATWRKAPFGAWKIERLLDEVTERAEAVRACTEILIEEVIVDNYAATLDIRAQLGELFRQQREMLMSINANNSKTHLLDFLMEQLSVSTHTLIQVVRTSLTHPFQT